MKAKQVSMMVAIAVMGLVSANNAGATPVMSQGFNSGFDAGAFYGAGSLAVRFVGTTLSQPPTTSATEGDGYSVIQLNRTVTDGAVTLLGRGNVDLETITAAGQTYTFTGDFTWRFPSGAGVINDIYIGSGSGFRVDGVLQAESKVDFEFFPIAQNSWSQYAFSYTTVAADIGKELVMSIDILDRDNVSGTNHIITDNWQVDVIPEPATLSLLGITGCVLIALRRLRI